MKILWCCDLDVGCKAGAPCCKLYQIYTNDVLEGFPILSANQLKRRTLSRSHEKARKIVAPHNNSTNS